MSTELIDIVKDLVKRVPDFEGLVRQAKTPPVTQVADTAYIYNAFYEMTLHHLGIPYLLKVNTLTKISAMPDYREIDQTASSGTDQIVWRNIPLKGEFIAREMIDLRGFDQIGFLVLTVPKITMEQKLACEEAAKKHIFSRIEAYKTGREHRRAGTHGYKIIPDPMVYHFMKKYTPDDPMFAEQSAKTDNQSQIANAISLLTQLVAQNRQAAEAVTVASPSISEPQVTTVAMEPPEPKAEIVVPPLKMELPRRRPLETTDAYNARIEQWKAEQAAKDAE